MDTEIIIWVMRVLCLAGLLTLIADNLPNKRRQKLKQEEFDMLRFYFQRELTNPTYLKELQEDDTEVS